MRHRQRTIAYLVPSSVDLIDLVAISSVFSYPTIDGSPAYSSVILSMQLQREVRSRDGLTLSQCIPCYEYKEFIDTLVVIGCEDGYVSPQPELNHWICRRAASASRIVSVGDGAFVLAPTGLLDGKHITTHWRHAARLKQLYPHLLIESDPIYIRDGKVCTTAGVTAGIDAALAIVEEDYGRAVVDSIARKLALYVRRDGNETQYSRLLALQTDAGGTPLRDLPAWAKSRLTQRLDVSTLAKFTSLTPRTLARQFEAHFQTTPARWVQSLRVEAACSLLNTPGIPIKVIAGRTGFRDEHALRRAFLQQLAITPKEYRERLSTSCRVTPQLCHVNTLAKPEGLHSALA